MARLRLAFMTVVLFISATAFADVCDFLPVTNATSERIHAWLRSGEPCLTAWGAYFTGMNKDQAAASELVELAEHWTPPRNQESREEHAKIAAMGYVLDGLIQNDQTLSPATLSSLAELFPTQVFIMASRRPVSEITPLLLAWYRDRRDWRRECIARFSAMMLAKAPPPGFAATVLDELEVHMTVVVRNHDHVVGVPVASCEVGGGSMEKLGWPPAMSYEFEENSPGNDSVAVEAGGDRITYVRGSRGCHVPRPLTGETRHHLLAEMLGVSPRSMPWNAEPHVVLYWKNRAQYVREVRQRVSAEERNLQQTVNALREKGVLTESEARSLRPRLLVTVFDEREVSRPPLPALVFPDQRTVVTLNKQ